MSDIVERLRSWVYTDSLYATARDAADEIERLRSRLRFVDNVIRSGDVATLTDAEREAVEICRAVMEVGGGGGSGCASYCAEVAATLRGLLERLSPPAT